MTMMEVHNASVRRDGSVDTKHELPEECLFEDVIELDSAYILLFVEQLLDQTRKADAHVHSLPRNNTYSIFDCIDDSVSEHLAMLYIAAKGGLDHCQLQSLTRFEFLGAIRTSPLGGRRLEVIVHDAGFLSLLVNHFSFYLVVV